MDPKLSNVVGDFTSSHDDETKSDLSTKVVNVDDGLLIARSSVFQKTELKGNGDDLLSLEVHGYDFNKGIDPFGLLQSFKTTGFQATNVAAAIDIINEMVNNLNFLFLFSFVH